MVRRNWLALSFALVMSLVCCSGAIAQDWVRAMFPENTHDFGNVPRGAKAEFRFSLTNKYEEDVHISSVRSSCGCTIPRVEKADLKTYEEGAIICEFNTRSFIGSKAAVVTVVFDRPFYGEMQLNVRGNIRSDIVTEPGEIQFGDVERGIEKVASVKVTYAGSKAWEIDDVRSANTSLGVKLEKLPSSGSRIEYNMQVRLKDDAPAGRFNDQIVIVTNDNEYNLVTVPVRGNVQPPLVLRETLVLGTIKTGGNAKNRLVIKGKSGFEIEAIECSDPRFEFRKPEGNRKAHIIPFEFKANEDVGAFQQTVTIRTNLPKDGVVSTIISGNITE